MGTRGTGAGHRRSSTWSPPPCDTTTVERTCHPSTGALLDHATSGHTVRRRHGRAGARSATAVPLPRLPRRRPLLRPRPRQTLARRPDHRHQPDLPVPPTPPRQTTPRLARAPAPRRHRHLDRPHRPTRTTHPIDALHVLVLPAPQGPGRRWPRRPTSGTTAVHSAIEFALEHALARLTRSDHERRAALHRIPSPARGRDGPQPDDWASTCTGPGEHRPRAVGSSSATPASATHGTDAADSEWRPITAARAMTHPSDTGRGRVRPGQRSSWSRCHDQAVAVAATAPNATAHAELDGRHCGSARHRPQGGSGQRQPAAPPCQHTHLRHDDQADRDRDPTEERPGDGGDPRGRHGHARAEHSQHQQSSAAPPRPRRRAHRIPARGRSAAPPRPPRAHHGAHAA